MVDKISPDEVKTLIEKYKQDLGKELSKNVNMTVNTKPETREYLQFRDEYIPKHMNWYEQACNYSEKILQLKPDDKTAENIQEALNTCHLNATPAGVTSFGVLAPFCIAFLGIVLTIVLFETSMFMMMFFVIFAGAMYLPMNKIPFYLANGWRMKASNQMVLSIFYIVSYMRHTSNLEGAIEFAGRHISPPLALDFKKILWDVETEKYESVKESVDMYLEKWRNKANEFIEAIHLIESSLYESSEDRRLTMLDKSLQVILDETYEKMLHYAQHLKSPITMLNMLGVILPILGLVILPLMVSFMEGIQWYHISSLYNLLLPVSIYYLGRSVLSTRPGGHGQSDLSDNKNLNPTPQLDIGGIKITLDPLMISITVGFIFLLLGFSPLIMHALGVQDFGFGPEDQLSTCGQQFCFLGYKQSQSLTDELGVPLIIGPFGMGSSVMSILGIFGLGISIGLYYKLKSTNIIEIRERSKELEEEFASAIFQLGNRIGDGIPSEIAFGKVAYAMQGTVSGKFFEVVATNIERLGMGVERAIFDEKTGAILQFPSPLIESSMKVLVESSKKGPRVAAEALMNISEYIKQMHAVDERLNDLMTETLSSIKSQIKFLTPVIAGVVIGITSMIITILGKLSIQMQKIQESSASAPGAGAGLMGLFGDGLPVFYFQMIVGLYVVQIIYILTILANGIENGTDQVGEQYALGRNMVSSPALYCFIAGFVMITFNMVAGAILARG